MSFHEALRHAMREAPDVIMIGEIRDRETMQHVIAYAETAHKQVLMDLSLNLKGVVGQQPNTSGLRVA